MKKTNPIFYYSIVVYVAMEESIIAYFIMILSTENLYTKLFFGTYNQNDTMYLVIYETGASSHISPNTWYHFDYIYLQIP